MALNRFQHFQHFFCDKLMLQLFFFDAVKMISNKFPVISKQVMGSFVSLKGTKATTKPVKNTRSLALSH